MTTGDIRSSRASVGLVVRSALALVGIGILLAAAWQSRTALLMLLVSVVLALGLDPLVRRVERFGVPRWGAVSLVAVLVVALVGVVAGVLVPPLIKELGQLPALLPDYLDRLRTSDNWLGRLNRQFGIVDQLQALLADLPSILRSSASFLLSLTRGVTLAVFGAVTVAILTVYLMLAMPRLRALGANLVARLAGPGRLSVYESALDRISASLLGSFLVALIAGVAAYIALSIIGVPFAALLATFIVITDLIPSVGATIGALFAIGVASLESLGAGGITALFFIVYQQLENHLIAPNVVGRAAQLSPLVIIVSVLVGASLAGIIGAFLAIPLAAAAKVVIDAWGILDPGPTTEPGKDVPESP